MNYDYNYEISSNKYEEFIYYCEQIAEEHQIDIDNEFVIKLAEKKCNESYI